jgi:hypothetical protein
MAFARNHETLVRVGDHGMMLNTSADDEPAAAEPPAREGA